MTSTIKNVLFITADQMRGSCLSALGHPNVKTPNLDRLAAEGTLFSRHFTQASPCGPARTSLLTGLYLLNHRSGRNGTPLGAQFNNLAKEARKAGFDPQLFGYTDTSPDPRLLAEGDPALTRYEGVLPGFSTGCLMTEDFAPWRAWLAAKGYEVPADPAAIFRPVEGSDPPRPVYPAEDSEAAFLAQQAMNHIAVQGQAPWFLHLVFYKPHPPFIAPEPYNALAHPDEIEAPRRKASAEEEAALHPYLAYLFEKQDKPGYIGGIEGRLKEMDEAAARRVRAAYYGGVMEVDAQVGRLVAFLKEKGLYEETLILFTCDHGEMLGDHWLWSKEGFFDQAYHIPCIVRDPRAGADAGRGRVVESFTEAVDLMPTILEALGREVPDACNGRSLLPFLAGETPEDWRREAHWEYDFREVRSQAAEKALGIASEDCCLNVIRGERYKYVHFAALPPLLFDLQEDPGETRNLAGDPAHAGILLEMAQKLLSWRMRSADQELANLHLGEGGVARARRGIVKKA